MRRNIVIIGGGPSVTPEQVEACRGQEVIAVNNAYMLAPWAAHLYAGDRQWWRVYAGGFVGQKWTGSRYAAQHRSDVQYLRRVMAPGLVSTPWTIAHGYNSGYQAINLAYHLGANRVALLGFDLCGAHWHGSHESPLSDPSSRDFARWRDAFERMDALGMDVVNCSGGELGCFPRMSIEDALR